ncbi:MAG TPA: acyltransferase [Isosphaeraceae bacterium]|jgi:peptidoglycan/LPS O-acetylase OafA/YrhL|nr:acyltransferase [Isosphaeraceae bacterium]
MHARFDTDEPKAKGAAYPLLASPRYRSLDMWRGLACLMIVLLHASFYAKPDDTAAARLQYPVGASLIHLINRMGVGVPMFFVISGYCIAATADSSRRKSRASLDYFKRRLRRIFPPYWVVLLLAIVLSWIVAAAGHPTLLTNDESPNTGTIPQPSTLTASQWFGNLTLTETWRSHLFGSPELKLLGPSWTLCYEEQFYVVCGLLLLLVPRRFFSGIVAVSVITAGMLVLSARQPWIHINGFFFDGNWLMFAAGVFVYYRTNYPAGAGSRLVPGALCLGLLTLMAVRYGLMRHSDNDVLKDTLYSLWIGAAFAVAILWLRPLDERICGIKVLAPIAFCGRMCYSLYLLHWPISKLISHVLFNMGVRGYWPVLTITIPVVTAVSIGASWVFYVLVERHFLNPPQKSSTRRDPELGSVGVPVLTAAGGTV